MQDTIRDPILYCDDIKKRLQDLNTSLVRVLVDGEYVGISPKIDLQEQIDRTSNNGRIIKIINRGKVYNVERSIELLPVASDELFAEVCSSKESINKEDKQPLFMWSKEHGLFVYGKNSAGQTKEEYIKNLIDKAWDVIYEYDMNKYMSCSEVKTIAEKKGKEGLKEYLASLAVKKYIGMNFGYYKFPPDDKTLKDIRTRFAEHCFDKGFTFSFNRIESKSEKAEKYSYKKSILTRLKAWLKGDKDLKKKGKKYS